MQMTSLLIQTQPTPISPFLRIRRNLFISPKLKKFHQLQRGSIRLSLCWALKDSPLESTIGRWMSGAAMTGTWEWPEK
ncbi:dolichyl-diphosphooligosaccharide--protein glycosyltransferase subunit 4-like [Platysternon megacephalum]|uniref:Dolichyl-diphosphooligosaccharide--protein glycosyltransferase subunit 4-like n=1 Tax=Platysternon megacephalum TaxID=55544 RepID=A0A4D9DLB9_9SAUR|nr:dolichyl-diphosphooligosaccharide--protein glycosyltransferase subunit 4-like [Platysternon megacephalum]